MRIRFPLLIPCSYRFVVPRLAFIAVVSLAASLSAAEVRPRVVTSFLPLYCWTVNVAGDLASVENLLPSRAEPHEYAFTPGDARKLGAADLIIVNGLGLESWLPKYLRTSPDSKDRVVVATRGVPAPEANPHVWLDPQHGIVAVSNILAALQRVDPVHAGAYASNAAAYVHRLRQLDSDIRESLATVTNHAIVTYHNAFPYFAQRYGLEVVGVVEQVPDVNPTPKYLAQLGHTMRERGLKVIYVSPNSANRLARRIAADLHVDLVELDTLEAGPLSPSAYEERMRANATVLHEHLK